MTKVEWESLKVNDLIIEDTCAIYRIIEAPEKSNLSVAIVSVVNDKAMNKYPIDMFGNTIRFSEYPDYTLHFILKPTRSRFELIED